MTGEWKPECLDIIHSNSFFSHPFPGLNHCIREWEKLTPLNHYAILGIAFYFIRYTCVCIYIYIHIVIYLLIYSFIYLLMPIPLQFVIIDFRAGL